VKPVGYLTNTEANRELLESPLVGGCWHLLKKSGLILINKKLMIYKCPKCRKEGLYSKFIKRPNYCTNWSELIPVIRGLKEKSKEEFFRLLAKCIDHNPVKIFDVSPRLYVQILLVIDRRGLDDSYIDFNVKDLMEEGS